MRDQAVTDAIQQRSAEKERRRLEEEGELQRIRREIREEKEQKEIKKKTAREKALVTI